MSIKSDVLEYLKAGNTLSGLDGLKLFGTLSVRNRISELRADGYNIKDHTVVNEKTKKHYSIYWISDEPQDTEHEAVIRQSNEAQEQSINQQAFADNRGQLAYF